jgi:hypothetical protein
MRSFDPVVTEIDGITVFAQGAAEETGEPLLVLHDEDSHANHLLDFRGRVRPSWSLPLYSHLREGVMNGT